MRKKEKEKTYKPGARDADASAALLVVHRMVHRPRHAQNVSGSNSVQTTELFPDGIGTKKFRIRPPMEERNHIHY